MDANKFYVKSFLELRRYSTQILFFISGYLGPSLCFSKTNCNKKGSLLMIDFCWQIPKDKLHPLLFLCVSCLENFESNFRRTAKWVNLAVRKSLSKVKKSTYRSDRITPGWCRKWTVSRREREIERENDGHFIHPLGRSRATITVALTDAFGSRVHIIAAHTQTRARI